MTTKILIIAYFVIANLVGFISMGVDKKKAKNHEWRISEAVLFFFAIIGGSLGSILGMKTFHHKTKHKAFIYGMPAILFIQIALIFTILFLPSLSIKIM